MTLQIGFRKYRGKTLEWIFFHDPGYIWWIIDQKIDEDRKKFSPALKKRFDDLVRRALQLKIPGLCTWCKKRPITRMFLTLHTSGGLARVDFDCDQCQYDGSSLSLAHHPSFYTPDFYKNYDKLG